MDESTLSKVNDLKESADDVTAVRQDTYKARTNTPISLTREHGDVPSLAVKAIAQNLIDNLNFCGRHSL